MRKVALISIALLLIAGTAFAQTTGTAIPLKNGWAMDINKEVSLMRLEKTDDGIVAKPAAGFGAGLTVYYANALGTVISFNLPEFILTTRVESNNDLDVLIGGDVGFLGNKLRIGGGWIHNDWVGLISIGL